MVYGKVCGMVCGMVCGIVSWILTIENYNMVMCMFYHRGRIHLQ